MPFSLPPGSIYKDPVDLTTQSKQEVFLREDDNSRISTLFKLNGNSFQKVDSLEERIVKDIGDFNNLYIEKKKSVLPII